MTVFMCGLRVQFEERIFVCFIFRLLINNGDFGNVHEHLDCVLEKATEQ